MNLDQFNEKSKILINEAQNKAILKNHQQVLPIHFILSIFLQNDQYLQEIISNCGCDIKSIF